MDVNKIIESQNFKTREDINKFMKDLVGEIMQQMLNKEFNEHMDYEKGKHSDNKNSRNGLSSTKNIRTNYGEFPIEMPRDREGSFEPKIVPKRKTILTDTANAITPIIAKKKFLS